MKMMLLESKMAIKLKYLCVEYISVFKLAGGYYGDKLRNILHQKIADIFNVSFDDLKPSLHHLGKKEIINFPLKNFDDYDHDQIMEWNEKTLKKWGYLLYDHLVKKYYKCEHEELDICKNCEQPYEDCGCKGENDQGYITFCMKCDVTWE